jgi:hypothetical protein
MLLADDGKVSGLGEAVCGFAATLGDHFRSVVGESGPGELGQV